MPPASAGVRRSGGPPARGTRCRERRVGSSGEAVYAACKGGLVALSKTLAREHARHGVTVNVVCPGPTDTPLFAEVAGSIVGLRHAVLLVCF